MGGNGPVRERERFIEAYLTGFYTITELADRFGTSRQKLHKWLTRHNVDEMKGLVDRSRAPLHTFRIERVMRSPCRSSRFVVDSRTWDRGCRRPCSAQATRCGDATPRYRPCT